MQKCEIEVIYADAVERGRSGARTHEIPWREWQVDTNQISNTYLKNKMKKYQLNLKRI